MNPACCHDGGVASPHWTSTGRAPVPTGRTYPASRSTRKISLSRELGGRRGDLVAVAGTGHPGEPQRVVRVARDDVHVEVEDGLPGGRSARVEQVHAVRPEALLDARGQLLRHPRAGLEVLARHV